MKYRGITSIVLKGHQEDPQTKCDEKVIKRRKMMKRTKKIQRQNDKDLKLALYLFLRTFVMHILFSIEFFISSSSHSKFSQSFSLFLCTWSTDL